jgi:hypothetical protein
MCPTAVDVLPLVPSGMDTTSTKNQSEGQANWAASDDKSHAVTEVSFLAEVVSTAVL